MLSILRAKTSSKYTLKTIISMSFWSRWTIPMEVHWVGHIVLSVALLSLTAISFVRHRRNHEIKRKRIRDIHPRRGPKLRKLRVIMGLNRPNLRPPQIRITKPDTAILHRSEVPRIPGPPDIESGIASPRSMAMVDCEWPEYYVTLVSFWP